MNNLSEERTAEVGKFLDDAKSAVTSSERGYRCSREVEAFALKNLPDFLKQRKQLTENIRLFASKAQELRVQSFKIENKNARDILQGESYKYMDYANKLSEQVKSINYQLEEIYAISMTADSNVYSDKLNNIMSSMQRVLQESENIKTDVKAMSQPVKSASETE